MQLGIVGLGRMGGNIARRLMRAGHECVVFDNQPATVDALRKEGATGVGDLAAVAKTLKAPRAIWLMLPAGAITEQAVDALAGALEPGDIIIDGGNSFYKDDIRRATALRSKQLHYVDVGTSGGVWGLERGYCMMIGGDKEAVDRLDPIFSALAPGESGVKATPGDIDPRAAHGYIHCGPTGSGHFVKMVHNGIEYGLMQAYAEGFEIMKHANSPKLPAEQRFDLRLQDIAEVWRRGSVVSSWLLDLTAISLGKDAELSGFTGRVEDSGEGRWTVNAAIEEAVPAEVITAALFARFRSRQEESFAGKLLSAMRNEFGGHVEPPTTGR